MSIQIKANKMIYTNISEFKKQIPSYGRLIGLDVGTKRIGVAISDTHRIISSPLEIIERINIKKDINKLISVMRKHEVIGIIMGLPLKLDGNENDMCQMVKNLSSKLAKEVEIPIFLQDERMSTQSAERVLGEYSLSWLKKTKVEDKVAASFILQASIDQLINYIPDILE